MKKALLIRACLPVGGIGGGLNLAILGGDHLRQLRGSSLEGINSTLNAADSVEYFCDSPATENGILKERNRKLLKNGDNGQIRTDDLLITSELLYP